jgi:hypothetical protein
MDRGGGRRSKSFGSNLGKKTEYFGSLNAPGNNSKILILQIYLKLIHRPTF